MIIETERSRPYSPLYFLAALGNGGLAVSFFIYLMFLLPHPKTPIPTFEDWYSALTSGSLVEIALVAFALSGVMWFAYRHVRLLFWNIQKYQVFKKSGSINDILNTEAEVQLMALPLTYAMTINVSFILGALFVPGLWIVVEWLFPFALVGFAIVAYFALKFYAHYLSNLLQKGYKNGPNNNNLSQLLAIFSFAMIAVGFAAPAAMSHITTTSLIGMLCSLFFLSAVGLLGLLKLVFGFRDILKNGISEEGAPSLWILIPILTVVGIAIIRLSHSYAHIFDLPIQRGDNFIFITIFLSLQLLIGLIGWHVMKKINYFKNYIYGDKVSSGSYALICPGVALVVFGMFFIHVALVKNALIEPLSLTYFALIAPLMFLQFKTIFIMRKLDQKHFC